MSRYVCPALVECSRADAREVFEYSSAEDPKCPGCDTKLELLKDDAGRKPERSKVLPLAGGGLALLIAVGAVVYFSSGPNAPRVEANAPVAPAPATSAPPVMAVAGLPPLDTETEALRKEGEQKLLGGGQAGEAEAASSRAAANELIKLAISKMTQGRLAEAEQDMLAAREKNAKDPLSFYNMGVLRLQQDRTDDALKEFEAAFILGFNRFDHIDSDKDLDRVRKNPRFVGLIAKYRPAAK